MLSESGQLLMLMLLQLSLIQDADDVCAPRNGISREPLVRYCACSRWIRNRPSSAPSPEEAGVIHDAYAEDSAAGNGFGIMSEPRN